MTINEAIRQPERIALGHTFGCFAYYGHDDVRLLTSGTEQQMQRLRLREIAAMKASDRTEFVPMIRPLK